MDSIRIEQLHRIEALQEAVELQKVYWGQTASNLVPAHMLHSLARNGGHVLGAHDGQRLVGFVMGFLGTDSDNSAADTRPAMANLLIFSKRMLVLPGYRGRNIGFRLKLAQRDIALRQAVRLITWTVDPLLAANAHLNLRKLGAIVQHFRPNYVELAGADSLRADRLLVEWWVTQRRASQRAQGRGSRLSLQQYLWADAPIVNPARKSGSKLSPAAAPQFSGTSLALVEIPPDCTVLEAEDRSLATAWRQHIRHVFQRLFAQGYIITDFVSGQSDGQRRAYYVFSCSFQDKVRQN